jgi:hypothetical protein
MTQTLTLDDVFGPLLTEAGFQPGAVAPGRALYVAEVAGSREVLVTITGAGFELVTFLGQAEAFGYRQLESARDARDGVTAVEFDGSWVLRRRIAAHPSDPANRMMRIVIDGAADLARYADLVERRLEASSAPAHAAAC